MDKKLLISSLSILSIILSIPLNMASAHHTRLYRPGIIRVKHHHHIHRQKRHFILWRRLSSTHGLIRCSNQGQARLNAVRVQLIKDIELSRLEADDQPLKVTTPLQRVANYRVVRNKYAYEHYNRYLDYPHDTSNPSDNWIHGIDTYTTAGDYFNQHGYIWHRYGSNASCWNPTKPRYDDGILALYGISTKDIADNFDNELMSHDNVHGNHNGHRIIELDPRYKYLGVSVRFSYTLNSYIISEQFAC